MKCPYCSKEIPDEAIECPFCHCSLEYEEVSDSGSEERSQAEMKHEKDGKENRKKSKMDSSAYLVDEDHDRSDGFFVGASIQTFGTVLFILDIIVAIILLFVIGLFSIVLGLVVALIIIILGWFSKSFIVGFGIMVKNSSIQTDLLKKMARKDR